MEGVQWLKEYGFRIYGVVIDGIRGLAQVLLPPDLTLSTILCKWKQDSVVSFLLYLYSVFKNKHKFGS